MAGLTAHSPTPTAITVHQQSRVLEVAFDDGAAFRIPFELMRVYSPSAEVQGHGPGQEVLQTGKRLVGLVGLAEVGNYAVQPSFSDGHESGIFSWPYLYHLGSQQAVLWEQYESRLQKADASRDAPIHDGAKAISAANGAVVNQSASGTGHAGAAMPHQHSASCGHHH